MTAIMCLLMMLRGSMWISRIDVLWCSTGPPGAPGIYINLHAHTVWVARHYAGLLVSCIVVGKRITKGDIRAEIAETSSSNARLSIELPATVPLSEWGSLSETGLLG